jgi:hypothetical protein
LERFKRETINPSIIFMIIEDLDATKLSNIRMMRENAPHRVPKADPVIPSDYIIFRANLLNG